MHGSLIWHGIHHPATVRCPPLIPQTNVILKSSNNTRKNYGI
uniref:Uncharacterized protein n=1 Tax=Populus trichocarpa TaxID=3694 RepID=A0A3N7G5Y8_POPTR